MSTCRSLAAPSRPTEIIDEFNGFNRVPVITVAGELDLTNAKQVSSAIEAALSGHGQRVVFEVSELTFMDSSGIALLASVARQAREIELRDPTPIVRRLIEMTGLDQLLRIAS